MNSIRLPLGGLPDGAQQAMLIARWSFSSTLAWPTQKWRLKHCVSAETNGTHHLMPQYYIVYSIYLFLRLVCCGVHVSLSDTCSAWTSGEDTCLYTESLKAELVDSLFGLCSWCSRNAGFSQIETVIRIILWSPRTWAYIETISSVKSIGNK